MELYFKDLISTEDSLEKLVDDLSLIVQGADDFAKSIGAEVPEPARELVARRASRLQERCRRMRQKILSGAQATDTLLRRHPYTFLTAAFIAGAWLGRNRRKRRVS